MHAKPSNCCVACLCVCSLPPSRSSQSTQRHRVAGFYGCCVAASCMCLFMCGLQASLSSEFTQKRVASHYTAANTEHRVADCIYSVLCVAAKSTLCGQTCVCAKINDAQKDGYFRLCQHTVCLCNVSSLHFPSNAGLASPKRVCI